MLKTYNWGQLEVESVHGELLKWRAGPYMKDCPFISLILAASRSSHIQMVKDYKKKFCVVDKIRITFALSFQVVLFHSETLLNK